MFNDLETSFIIGSGGATPFELAGSPAIDGQGVPTQRFRKELIRVGDFSIDNGTRNMSVKPGDLQHWANTFKSFIAAGNKVSIPNGHANHGDPEKNMGWVSDMFVEGDKLIGVCDIIGKDAIEAANKSGASIWAVQSYQDSNKNQFDWPIRHVAMTTDPQITGLGPFVAIAASRTETPVDVPVFKPSKGPNMTWDKIKKHFGISDDMTDENAAALLLAVVIPTPGDDKALEEAKATIKELELAVKNAGNKEIKLSVTERYAMGRTLDLELSVLVKDNKLSSAASKQLKAAMESDVMLSVDESTKAPAFEAILKAIGENKPVELSQATGVQTEDILLSNDLGSEDYEAEREKTQKEMQAM